MASRRTRHAVSGLLTGLGVGLTGRADRERQDALALREEALRRLEIEGEREFTRERDAAAATERRGLLSTTTVDENRNLRGLTAGGDVIETGIRVPAERAAGAESGLSAGDQRLIDTAIERHTTQGGLAGQNVIDWGAAARTLEQQGRPDLARFIAPAEGGVTLDRNSEEWATAQEMAEEEIKNLTTMLGSDKEQLAEFGGNRVRAREELTQRFYRQITGQEAPASSTSTRDQPSSAAESSDYDTAEEVREDFRSGRITREEALRILREQFQME